MVVSSWQDPALYDKLPEPTDDENDMLDLAYGLTETYATGSLPVILQEMEQYSAKIGIVCWQIEGRDEQDSSCDCRSRLGCQVIASKDIDGIRVRIPGATRNFAVDGYKPKPH